MATVAGRLHVRGCGQRCARDASRVRGRSVGNQRSTSASCWRQAVSAVGVRCGCRGATPSGTIQRDGRGERGAEDSFAAARCARDGGSNAPVARIQRAGRAPFESRGVHIVRSCRPRTLARRGGSNSCDPSGDIVVASRRETVTAFDCVQFSPGTTGFIAWHVLLLQQAGWALQATDRSRPCKRRSRECSRPSQR